MENREFYFLTNSEDKLLLQLGEGRMKALSLKAYARSLFRKKDSAKTILVAASKNKKSLLRMMDIFDHKNRLILWYWDTVTGDYGFVPPPYKRIECWSFDERDCQKYGMKHNSQVYYANPQNHVYATEEKASVFYCGADRGREEKLQEIFRHLLEQGATAEFSVVESRSHAYPQEQGWQYVDAYIPYTDYLKKMQSCQVICECMMPGQTGLTLRLMEAMFFQKKLITDNAELLSQPQIYRPENIFIIGHDTWESLPAFLEEPFQPWPEEIRNYYRFDAWLERFQA